MASGGGPREQLGLKKLESRNWDATWKSFGDSPSPSVADENSVVATTSVDSTDSQAAAAAAKRQRLATLRARDLRPTLLREGAVSSTLRQG